MQGDVENFTRWVELYKDNTADKHMRGFITSAGERNVYDCVSLCNRCALCHSKCPTAAVTKSESHSPRGRVQLLRMAMEERLKLARDGSVIAPSFESCLHCWACVAACSSGTPVPELVLEGRRALGLQPGSALGKFLVSRLSANRRLLALPLKAFNMLRKTPIYTLLAAAGFFRMLGQPWLGRFNRAGLPARMRFLDQSLKDASAGAKTERMSAACLYFSPCSVNYFYPETGLSTVELLKSFVGPVRHLRNGCCGYAAYRHGELRSAKSAGRAVIALYEAAGERLPVVTDCPSCAAFLRGLEQLFSDDAQWRAKAAALAGSVKFISEVLTPEKVRARLRAKRNFSLSPSSVRYPAAFDSMRVTFNDSCAACHRLGASSGPRKILASVFGERYAEMPEADLCCGGADGYALFQPEMAHRLGLRKTANAASVQPDVVVATSPVCVAQISENLRRYYPHAVAVHYSDFLRDMLSRGHDDAKKA